MRFLLLAPALLAWFVSLAVPGWPQAASGGSLAGFRLMRILELKGTTYHVQGIDFDSRRMWVTSVDRSNLKGYLHVFSVATGRLIRTTAIQQGERFHPGGISADAASLWIPLAEYRPNSTSVIQKRSKLTLEVEFQFDVPDHIGCIAVTPDRLIGGNWDSREFYKSKTCARSTSRAGCTRTHAWSIGPRACVSLASVPQYYPTCQWIFAIICSARSHGFLSLIS